MSNVSKGKEFEDQIAELYRLMGYEVTQNVGILGHQIDIILTYTMPGGIKTITAVECKYVEKGNLTKNDVFYNINALRELKINEDVQNLTIITTNGFAKDIWDTAKANQIQLLTFRELQYQILKLDQYLDRLIKNYETDELSKYYIDLIAQDDERMPRKIFDPMDDYVNDWLVSEESNYLSILGEYGAGKTSFCRKLAHDLAIKYNNDPLNNRIPILIYLRDYSKVMSVRQLITDLLINEYGLRGIDYPLFEKMNEEGLFLMIFDGFDEMAQKVLFDVAYSNFNKIAELAKPKKSKVILTCRTEFFITQEKEKEILLDVDKRKNFDIIYIKEFNDVQFKEFLQKRVPLMKAGKEKRQGWEYYYEKIQNAFDLKDLAKRPVLLDMITKSFSQLIKEGETFNVSAWYLFTIQEELNRRLMFGSTIIRKEDRFKLMKVLAMWMYNHDKFSIYYEDILELLDLKKNFDLKTRTDIEYHLNDFLTYSFLSRDTDGNYSFSHKSFVDFLVALQIVENIDSGKSIDPELRISKEVKSFISDFLPEVNIEQVFPEKVRKHKVKIDSKRLSDKATLNRMAAIVAHQIGGLTALLRTHIQNMINGVPDNVKVLIEDDYDKAIAKLESINRWREDILTASRLMNLKKREISIGLTIQELSKQVEACYPEIKVELQVENNIVIFADEDRIIQALKNLISNACESMSNKGKLVLGLSKGRDNVVKFTIEDTGTGINKKEFARIFEEFYTTKSNGIGLGLTIVRNIVHAHDGNIFVESKLGKGTRFTIAIPTR